jgi:ABC-type glycerol-3-phosphate transport system permease component
MPRIVILTVAVLLAIVVLAPVIWLMILSVSSTADIYTIPLRWIPSDWDLSRYGRLLAPDPSGNTSPFLLALRNSLIVGVAGTIIALAISAPAAWHISRAHAGEGLLHVMVGTYMLPQTVMALPLYVMLSSSGLLNRPSGLVIVYLGFLVPFTTWLLKTGFDQVPRQLDDAARVDGLGASASWCGSASRLHGPASPPPRSLPCLWRGTSSSMRFCSPRMQRLRPSRWPSSISRAVAFPTMGWSPPGASWRRSRRS